MSGPNRRSHVQLALAGLKGGTAKTTSSVFLAHVLAQAGPTLLVDTDPQGSALSWSEAASFPVPTIALPVRDVHRRLPQLAAGYAHTILDTPPGDLPIVRSALLAADVVVIPLPPTAIDLDRLRPTLELLAELENLRIGDVDVRVLLTRVRSRTRTARTAREVLVDLGLPVLDAEIPLRESYAGAFGAPVPESPDYAAVAAELLRSPVAAL